jgi:RimJ/RimL family protein N-acetyltransferase
MSDMPKSADVVTPRLETDRLVLRAWMPTDVRPYERMLADRELMRGMSASGRPSPRRFVSTTLARFTDLYARRAISDMERGWIEDGLSRWAVEDRANGRLIGQLGFNVHRDWSADPARTAIGWMLARDAWGRGLATEGGRACLEYAFGEFGLDRVISTTYPGNLRSRRVMERLGLEFAGYTRWRGADAVWYAIDRHRWLLARE